MLTDSLHDLSSFPADLTLRQAKDFVSRIGSWTRDAIGARHGHDLLLQFEGLRVNLRGASCGYQVRGWSCGRSHD